ncbi:ribonucleotide reductase subunit 2 [Macropodid alphaherpesvirus 2]|uniref:ribonucleoside-diphosphate reductase n=1 Tax=Macropodid alphaherpesvirus 2 TaxID=83440 RepID=A0AAE7MLL8_9ALPH|nr:ribonucleotide reductase subunit 2 [Macropodid alphaherpesvirus 2]QOD40233.1 ribonucleotide reductase subunit 2 [Macropodid alphaherpesvirus 2]WGO49724.1 ribonucleotide reductase subunit 2 [Macropodid alphaherpesvirus 2]
MTTNTIKSTPVPNHQRAPDSMGLVKYFYTPQCPEINTLRTLSVANRWLESEFVFVGDETDVSRLSREELDFYRFLFTFLAAADDLVAEELGDLAKCFVQKDIAHYYSEQENIEVIHSRTYSIIQLILFNNNAEAREKYVLDNIDHPSIQTKVAWINSRVRECDTLPGKLLFMILIEGIFFAASFAAIAFLRTNNLLRVTCQTNDLISRDEAIHTTASCTLYNLHVPEHHKPPPNYIYRLFREAVDIEISFIRSRAPSNSTILDRTALLAIEDYVRFSADRLLGLINMDPIFNVSAPSPDFPLRLMSVEKHTNFFECRNTAYTGTVVNDL